MIESRLLAGVVAAIPISIVAVAYVLLRRDAMLPVFVGDGQLSRDSASVVMVAAAALVPLLIGLAAGFVYGWVPSDLAFAALALGLATLFSLAAVVTRTPLMVEKIVLNYLVAVVLGLGLPRLVAPG